MWTYAPMADFLQKLSVNLFDKLKKFRDFINLKSFCSYSQTLLTESITCDENDQVK